LDRTHQRVANRWSLAIALPAMRCARAWRRRDDQVTSVRRLCRKRQSRDAMTSGPQQPAKLAVAIESEARAIALFERSRADHDQEDEP